MQMLIQSIRMPDQAVCRHLQGPFQPPHLGRRRPVFEITQQRGDVGNALAALDLVATAIRARIQSASSSMSSSSLSRPAADRCIANCGQRWGVSGDNKDHRLPSGVALSAGR